MNRGNGYTSRLGVAANVVNVPKSCHGFGACALLNNECQKQSCKNLEPHLLCLPKLPYVPAYDESA